jgi:hypothetical protein
MTTRLLLPLMVVFALVTAWAADDPERYRTSGSYSGKQKSKYFEMVVRQSDLDKTADWDVERSDPPLSPRSAVLRAKEQLRKLLPECDNPAVTQVSLIPIGRKGQWIYRIDFLLPAPQGTKTSVPFSILVLMNGHPVQGNPVQSQNQKDFMPFEIGETSVAFVLDMYRELVGGLYKRADLDVAADVPLNSKVDLRSHSASREEAVKIIEAALREQAGVVLTPKTNGGYTVHYDPKTKKSR